MGTQLAHLLRPFNLMAIALIQIICFYTGGIGTVSSFFIFILMPTLLSAAAGYIINNYFDLKKDEINNKPKISPKNLPVFYILLNLVGLGIAFFDNWTLVGLIFGIQVLLFLYSYKLSNWPLVGNVLVALLSCFVVLIFYFSARASISIENIWVFIISIFLVSMAREIIKDIVDIAGDREYGAQTLPIVLGSNFSHVVADLMLFCNAFFILIWSYYDFFLKDNLALIIGVVLSIIGVGIIIISHLIKKPRNFLWTSRALKIYMFLGLTILPFLKNA